MVTVTPNTFTMVDFDAATIAAVFDAMAERIDGLPEDLTVELVIDEDEVTTNMAITSIEPAVFALDSGALENTRKPQSFGEEMASNSIGRLLYEYLDRTSPDFGAPPVGEPTDLAQRVAWDVYCFGRVSRLGVRVYRPKHLYNFRNRHGFSDAADAVFDQLWSADGLTWADIVSMCPPPAD